MPRLQATKRKDGSTNYYTTLPITLVRELGWSKGIDLCFVKDSDCLRVTQQKQ